MALSSDTIAALATPVGTSAIAVVRISGSGTKGLVQTLVGREVPARRVQRFDYRDREGALLDDVLGTYFPGPHSYTGEDVFEISAHGNPYLVQRVLQDLLVRGCRAAAPGEFTQRAFLNGRMDLSQAEAVADLIQARSESALKAANQQLRGALGRHVATITDRLVRVLAQIEAYIDFPEEDLPPEDRDGVLEELSCAERDTRRLLATQQYGSLLRDGIRTVIIGAANVGKSSILNKLTGSDRAIVSPEPGTTRDFLEERILLGAHCFRLTDTAGLNPAPGTVERLGIQKTYERLDEADLVLAVVDLSLASPSLPAGLVDRLDPKSTILVRNKVDLCSGKFPLPSFPKQLTSVDCSAVTGVGITELVGAMTSWADSRRIDVGDDVIAVNARHAHELERALDSIVDAGSKLRGSEPVELLASDVRGALDALGMIGGRVDNERILDALFATFCIGK